MKYKEYSQYKKINVEWPSEIPSHWRMSKLRYIFSFTKGLTITKDNLQEKGVPCVNYGEVHSECGFEVDPTIHTLKYVSEIFLKDNPESLLSKGDFVFADTSEDLDGAGNFTQLISDDLVFAGYHTIIARPLNRINGRFFAYLLDSKELRSQIKNAVKGVKVFSITQEILRNLNIWIPSVEEQLNISNFLDYEIKKIDRLIIKQMKLVERLKEKQQVVISHVVTKGLNPNVKMKDSGVEWIGLVPEHWEVKKLKHTSKIIDCKNRTPEYFEDGDYFVVRTTNVKNRTLTFDKALYTNEENFKLWTERGVPPVGSVLFTREAPVGEVCLVPENVKLCMGQRMMNFIPFEAKFSNFLFDYLTSDCLARYIASEASGSTVTHLRVEQVHNIPIVVPPVHEQAEIDYLVHGIKRRYSVLTEKAQAAINLAKERRSALISAAVTGKIDVRNCQPDAKDVA